MRFEKAFIPYGAYWSTPFCKWQGPLSTLNSVHLAAQATTQAMAQRDLTAQSIDGVVLGMTVPQKNTLYGGPWFAALVGAEHATGTMVAQACATGARALATAAAEVETSDTRTVLSVTTDRCSNGPHIYYPNPAGPGGTGEKEDWVMDSFGHDPWAKNSMLQTAENVAAKHKITREEQDETTLVRHAQYQDALADDAKFLKRFMLWPFEVKDARGRKVLASVEGDQGVFPTNREGLQKLRTVMPDGTVTFGSQTHPADGSCGIVVTSEDRQQALSRNRDIRIRLRSYGHARTDKGHMAEATAPAARAALAAADVKLDSVSVIKTHNPFAVNDVFLARELGIQIDSFNRFGSSLIYGHPQGPTGARLIIETIEELVLNGGGLGLFVGCAAGDTAGAVVVEVEA